MKSELDLGKKYVNNCSIHAGKTVPIVKGGEQVKMEEGEVRWMNPLDSFHVHIPSDTNLLNPDHTNMG